MCKCWWPYKVALFLFLHMGSSFFKYILVSISLHCRCIGEGSECRPFQILRCCLEASRSRAGIENFGRVYKQTLHPCKEIQIFKFYFFTLFYFLCFSFHHLCLQNYHSVIFIFIFIFSCSNVFCLFCWNCFLFSTLCDHVILMSFIF